MLEYDKLEIDKLIEAVKSGDDDACGELLRRYSPLVDKMVYSTMPYLSSATRSDEDELRQEATIKLYQSALSYDEKQTEISFGLYAKICIKNRMISLSRRHRGSDTVTDEELDKTAPLDIDYNDPSETLLDRESERELLLKIRSKLSPLEYEVYDLYMDGIGTAEIAATLDVSEKAVENALYRMRTKLHKLFLE